MDLESMVVGSLFAFMLRSVLTTTPVRTPFRIIYFMSACLCSAFSLVQPRGHYLLQKMDK